MFNTFSRQRALDKAQQDEFDLLIVGGGINGAGVARDAAMRGLRVLLLEALEGNIGKTRHFPNGLEATDL